MSLESFWVHHRSDKMKRGSDLIRIATFNNSLKAHSLRILLEANGIQATVDGDTAIDGFDPKHVYVSRENSELARQVMQEVPAASEILIPAWKCECEEQVDEGFHVCWSCGRPCPE